jgi:hypothetical protein
MALDAMIRTWICCFQVAMKQESCESFIKHRTDVGFSESNRKQKVSLPLLVVRDHRGLLENTSNNKEALVVKKNTC